jgi:hypothetical protein
MEELAQGVEASPLESDSLLRAARAAGFELGERKLETLRAQGLLPAPTRAGNRGRIPVWLYPAGTDAQLVSLLGWREFTKDPNTLAVLLWLDGFPIATSQVRISLVRYLRAALDAIDREITAQAERLGLDPDRPEDRRAALAAIAARLAGRRGPNAPPRPTRVSAADRQHAFELMMRAFALGEDVQATSTEAGVVERVLGVAPNGRHDRVGGAGPWLTGPAEDLFDAAEVTAFPNALQAVDGATDVELETARGIVLAIFRYMPLMARLMETVFDKANHAGFAGLRDLDQHPEQAVFLVPVVVSMLRAGWQENISQIADMLGNLAELPGQAAQLLDMPHNIVEANLQGQPQETRQMAQRLIEAALNSKLDPAPLAPPTPQRPTPKREF